MMHMCLLYDLMIFFSEGMCSSLTLELGFFTVLISLSLDLNNLGFFPWIKIVYQIETTDDW